MSWRVVQACLWHLCLLFNHVSCVGMVQRLSPTSGSLCGGNRLSIYGSGFAKEASANRVEIGNAECKVETVSDSKLVCQVPFRHDQVVTGKETASELVTVHANGEPMSMAEPLKFKFKAEAAPVIDDWGPAAGQANDVLSFQGKNALSGLSVTLDGRECEVKHAEGDYLQCRPPPREAGISSVEVNFGPDKGFACPGPKAPPLKFTYNLALQSALPDELGGHDQGPMDGGGQLTDGPCSPRSPPSGTLVIVGQGLGNSTVFKLCGGDAWCTREGAVSPDPAMYHDGDWSFQTVACRPGPLDPIKAPGGSRKCELTAEAAEGMFVATLADAWTYGPPTLPVPTSLAPASPAQTTLIKPTGITVATTTMPEQVHVVEREAPAPASSTVAHSLPAAQAVIPLAPAPAPVAPLPAPVVPAPAPASTQQLPSKKKKTLKRMATKVLGKAFEKIAEALAPKSKLPPPYPVSPEAVQVPTELPPPSPVASWKKIEPVPMPPRSLQADPIGPPGNFAALAPAPGPSDAFNAALLQEVEAALKPTPPLLRGARRHLCCR